MTQPDERRWVSSARRQAALSGPLRELHQAVLRPATAVVVFGSIRDCGTDCGPWEVMCPSTTFHASRDSAQAYLAARGDIDGQILDQDAAVEEGRRNFGPLLGGTM